MSNLPFGSEATASNSSAGPPDPRQRPFRPGHAVPIRPVIRRLPAKEPASPPPVFPLPLGHRHSLLGSSCARWDIVHPHGRPTSRNVLRLDPIGVVTFHMRQIRPGWAPSEPRGRWCAPARPNPSGQHPPPCNGRSLSPAGASHRAEVPMTRRHRGFTCVHPSGLPQPVTPGWNRDPWAFPRASHPAVTRDARRGGDGPCARDRTLHPRRQVAPPSMRVAALMRLTCRTTMFSQDACFGVYVAVNRGCAASQARVAFEVWLEPLSRTR